MRRRLSNLLASAGAVAVSLALGEGLLRLLLPAPPLVSVAGRVGAGVDAVATPRGGQAVGNLYVQTDAGLRLRPHVDLTVTSYPVGGRTVRISTDAHGMRRVERRSSAAAVVPTLFLGDSVTFGEGVSDDETFVQALDGRSLADGRAIRAWNAAVPGYGLVNELEMLADLGDVLRPERVVLVLYLNDAIPSPAVTMLSPPALLARSRLVSQVYVALSRAVGRIAPREGFMPDATAVAAWQRQVLEDRADPSRSVAARHLDDWGVAWSDGVWDWLEPMFVRFREECARLGARPLVVIAPVIDQVQGAPLLDDRPQRALRELAGRIGIESFDLLPGLRAASGAAGEPLFLDHCHYSPRGHAVVADLIGAALGGDTANPVLPTPSFSGS